MVIIGDFVLCGFSDEEVKKIKIKHDAAVADNGSVVLFLQDVADIAGCDCGMGIFPKSDKYMIVKNAFQSFGLKEE